MNTITVNPDTESKYSLIGIALSKVENANINNLKSSGFASSVVQIIDSNTIITNGEISKSLSTGVLISDKAEVTLKNMNISSIYSGATPYGYGVVVKENAHLITENVELSNNKMAGMLIDHATGHHKDLLIDKNINRGVWMQFCEARTGFNNDLAVAFEGANTTFSNNQGISFGAYKSKGINVDSATITDTSKLQMVAEGTVTGLEEIGEGIEILASSNVKLKDMVIFNSERIGVVVDFDPEMQDIQDNLPMMDVVFDNVIIDGVGDRGFSEQRGRIDQGPVVIPESLIEADAVGGLLNTVKPLLIDNLPSAVLIDGGLDVD